MTTTIQVIKVMFNTALTFLTSVYIPGTNISPLTALIGSTIIILSIKILKNLGGSYDV